MSPVLPAHEFAPFVNSAMLAGVLVLLIVLYVKSKGWSAPALKSAIDHLYSMQGATSRSQQELYRSLAEIRDEQKALDIAHRELNGRFIDVDNHRNQLSETLAEIKRIVESLACAQRGYDDESGEFINRKRCPHVNCPQIVGSKE